MVAFCAANFGERTFGLFSYPLGAKSVERSNLGQLQKLHDDEQNRFGEYEPFLSSALMHYSIFVLSEQNNRHSQ